MSKQNINASSPISPSQRLAAEELRTRAPRGPETGRMEADQASFAYPGVQIPDFKDAREWKPGRSTMNGTQANQLITGLYTQLDQGMTAFLGEPAIANWTTFGKFASQNAGNQITRLEALERASRGKSLTAFTSLAADTLWNPNDTRKSFIALKNAKLEGKSFFEKGRILRDALVNGNTSIIRDIAPAFDVFLRAESSGKDGLAALRAAGFGREPLDPHGLILQAFGKYAEARRLGERMREFPPVFMQAMQADHIDPAVERMPGWKEFLAMNARRDRVVTQANLLLGFQEQLVSLQTPEVFGNPDVAKLMESLSRGMSFRDARGKTQLLPNGGNWADFVTRMGLEDITGNEAALDDLNDLVVRLRHPDGSERVYRTKNVCEPGNIANFMKNGTTSYHAEIGSLLNSRPEGLSRFYVNNPVFRILAPVRWGGQFLGGLAKRLFG